MKVTINWTDHRYSTHDFKMLDQLPEIGSSAELNGWRYTLTGVRDLTDMASRSDFGDGGYMKLYLLYFDDEELISDLDEDGTPFEYYEPAGEHYEYAAVWHSYKDE